jgi:hypothetical protein
MSKTVHSVKLQAYDSIDLDRLSYSNGDLVYDLTNSTIRLMDGTNQGGKKIATQSWTTLQLSSYVTTAGLATAISNSSALSGYVSTTSLTTTLNSYVTGTSLTTTLSSYVTSASLTSTLNSYVTSASLTTTLSSYVTSASLATSLSGLVSTTSLTTTLNNYATTTSVALKAPLNGPTFTGVLTAPSAQIGGVDIKAFAAAMGAALA